MSRIRTVRRLATTTVALALAISAGLAGCVLVPYGDGPRGYGGYHERHEHHEYAHHDGDGWRYDGRRE